MRIMTYGYKSGIGYTDWGWKDGDLSAGRKVYPVPQKLKQADVLEDIFQQENQTL